MTTLRTTLHADRVGPDAALTALVQEGLAHAAVRHPFLATFARGCYRDPHEVLRHFAQQYSGYASWFPHYLQCVDSRLQCPDHRALLQQKLEHEQGALGDDDLAALRRVGIPAQSVSGIPHAQLFRRFCLSLGITDWEVAQPSPAARQWRAQLQRFLNHATAAQAIGALGLGTEQIVRPIYRQLLEGILGLGTMRRDQFLFFELHCIVPDQHLLAIAKDLAATPGGIADLRSGMHTALQLREEFWDQLSVSLRHERLANPA